MQDRLKQKWLDLWQRIGAKGDAEKVYNALAARYQEAHRQYHTLSHIEHCLEELEQVKHLAKNPDAIEMALWWHDVIYNTRAKDNEERSAALAWLVLRKASLPDEFTGKVTRFILATKHTFAITDPDARLMADIDLSSLGLPYEEFDENSRRIREEYGWGEWVPEEIFTKERIKFLESLLERPFIYGLWSFREKYEARARRNIARAIAQLSKK